MADAESTGQAGRGVLTHRFNAAYMNLLQPPATGLHQNPIYGIPCPFRSLLISSVSAHVPSGKLDTCKFICSPFAPFSTLHRQIHFITNELTRAGCSRTQESVGRTSEMQFINLPALSLHLNSDTWSAQRIIQGHAPRMSVITGCTTQPEYQKSGRTFHSVCLNGHPRGR